MKKTFSTIVAIILVFALIPLCVGAAGGSATMSSASASAGETVKLSVKLSGIPEIKTGSIEITGVPDGIKVVDGEWVGEAWISNFDSSDLRGVFAFETALDKTDVKIFNLTVKVTEKASVGENRISFNMKFQNENGDWLTDFVCNDGIITVKEASASGEPDGEGGEGSDPDDGSTDPDELTDGEDGEYGDDVEDGDIPYDTDTEDGVIADDTDINGEVDGAEKSVKSTKSGLSPLAIVLICAGAAVVVAAAVIIIISCKKKSK